MENLSNIPSYVVALSVKQYPHLNHIDDAKTFCLNLTCLEAVKGIPAADYIQISEVATGGWWEWTLRQVSTETIYELSGDEILEKWTKEQ